VGRFLRHIGYWLLTLCIALPRIGVIADLWICGHGLQRSSISDPRRPDDRSNVLKIKYLACYRFM